MAAADQGSVDVEYWTPPTPPFLESYEVVDAGEGEVLVPLLCAAAPDVAESEVKATLEVSSSTKVGLVIKILGNGFGGSAKITVTDTRTMTAAAGEIVGLAVAVPVVWERRADPTNEDHTWSHVEVKDDGRTKATVRTFTGRQLVDLGRAVATEPYDTTDSGSKPLEVARERTVEGGASFSVGFKNEAAGIEATLGAELESSSKVALAATLPPGHRYDLTWWRTPNGVLVTEA